MVKGVNFCIQPDSDNKFFTHNVINITVTYQMPSTCTVTLVKSPICRGFGKCALNCSFYAAGSFA